MIMMETKFYVGNRVINLVPHFNEDHRLVPLNAVGFIISLGDKYEITWHIDEYPYHATTECAPTSIALATNG